MSVKITGTEAAFSAMLDNGAFINRLAVPVTVSNYRRCIAEGKPPHTRKCVNYFKVWRNDTSRTGNYLETTNRLK